MLEIALFGDIPLLLGPTPYLLILGKHNLDPNGPCGIEVNWFIAGKFDDVPVVAVFKFCELRVPARTVGFIAVNELILAALTFCNELTLLKTPPTPPIPVLLMPKPAVLIMPVPAPDIKLC